MTYKAAHEVLPSPITPYYRGLGRNSTTGRNTLRVSTTLGKKNTAQTPVVLYGALDPARWFGPAVASGNFDNWYVWWIGPLIGALAAAAIYRLALEDRARADVTPATPEGA